MQDKNRNVRGWVSSRLGQQQGFSKTMTLNYDDSSDTLAIWVTCQGIVPHMNSHDHASHARRSRALLIKRTASFLSLPSKISKAP